MSIDKWKSFRRSLHTHPETAFEELHTAAAIRDQLDALGAWQVRYPVGKTGVLALLDSGRPGPELLFRAELDALPIEERAEHDYASRITGKGHLCGHDGHAVILLALADQLVQAQPSRGKVYLIFQPAEETGAGAQAVLDDPAFAEVKPEWVFGLHNLPGKPLHQVVLRKGYFNASVCSMIVTLTGDSAHAGEPAKGRNPADVIGRILQLPEAMNRPDTGQSDFRIASPVYARLGSKAYGTSAGDGEVHLTLRAWNEASLQSFSTGMEKAIRALASEAGLDLEVSYTEFFRAIRNDDAAVELLAEAALKAGLKVAYEEQPFTWGEDFGRFTEEYKGAFFGLGAGEEAPALHRPDYDFPDLLIESGVRFYLTLIDLIMQPR